MVQEYVIGPVVEPNPGIDGWGVELSDLVPEVVEADTEEDLVLEEWILDAENGPLEVVNEGVGVGEVLGQVTSDDRAVGEEVEGDFGPLRLQSLCHVPQTRADLYLWGSRRVLGYSRECSEPIYG